MQEPITQFPHQSISQKFASARQRLRKIRRNLHSPFHRSGNPTEVDPPISDLKQSISLFPTLSFGFKPDMDGAAEKMYKLLGAEEPHKAPVSAIFVHAGAGYHSTTNEHIHLGACNDAARMAMRMLRAGGTAVDAVETAIKVLEDKEITNAGYGSNLSIKGDVECDATIVDHLGRSGACGATPQIKNPIHLARVILDTSTQPLSLRRVPPNLLVGKGATDFAYDHGIPVLPNEMIISKNAQDRHTRWKDDLLRAEDRLTPSSFNGSSQHGDEEINYEDEPLRNKQRRDHTNAILTGTWNEGQPDSPQAQSPAPESASRESPLSARRSPRSPDQNPHTPTTPIGDRSYRDVVSPPGRTSRSPISSPARSPTKRARYSQYSDGVPRTHSPLGPGSKSPAEGTSNTGHSPNGDGADSPTRISQNIQTHVNVAFSSGDLTPQALASEGDEDMITDTVGAIAIDMYGNIAAASSSGGIGMKHSGRVGPAALVGIGTAVIPIDKEDPDKISVAAVTSGTGEHMATTMASQKCAERLYHNTRRGRGGTNIPATEEEAMESFVQADFMEHPGVMDSNSTGAIGVMAVKKTPYGYFLHFAHNTDSFALASLHSNERDAKCVMSRINESGRNLIVRGGRKIAC